MKICFFGDGLHCNNIIVVINNNADEWRCVRMLILANFMIKKKICAVHSATYRHCSIIYDAIGAQLVSLV